VPYGPIFDEVRKNHGFTDTRGRPDLAAKIVEGTSSQALRHLLVRIAEEGAYFSLGCDLGNHTEEEAPEAQRQVAGGYIQVSALKYRRQKTDHYDRLAEAIEGQLRQRVGSAHWTLIFEYVWVRFRLPNESRVTRPSLWIWFFVAGATMGDAISGREVLIGVLSDVLHAAEVRSALVARPRGRQRRVAGGNGG